MIKHLLSSLAVCLLISGTAFGQFSTNFLNLTANNSTDLPITNGGITATFEQPGVIAFFNNSVLYDGSNRAYAVGSGQSADITFSTAVSVTGRARDTNNNGVGGSSSTVPSGTTLGLAVGTIEAFDAASNSLGTVAITDASFTGFSFAGPVTQLTVSNTSSAANSFSLIGQLQATAVPEPTSGVLVVGGLALLGLRRRRR